MPSHTLSLFAAICLVAASLSVTATETRGGFAPALKPSSDSTAQPITPPVAPTPRGYKAAGELRPLKDALKVTPILIQSGTLTTCNVIPPFDKKLEQKQLSAEPPVDYITHMGVGKHNFYYESRVDKIRHWARYVGTSCCDPNKSFTPQDQQLAGCLGTDTVSACMNKLTTQCAKKLEGYSQSTKNEIQKTITQLQNATAALTQLKQTLEELQNHVP